MKLSARDAELNAAIRSGFSSAQLSPAHRRIASHIAAEPEACKFLSAAELADILGVSQPSVTRFSQGQGFDGWAELRESLRRLSKDVVPELDRASGWVADGINAEIANLRRLASGLSDERLAQVGAQLLDSRPLLVMGVRATVGVAAQFGWFASKLHPDVRRVGDAGDRAFDQVWQARRAGATHMISYLLPRIPRSAHRLLRAADELGLESVIVAPRDTQLPFAAATRFDLPVSNSLTFHSSVSATTCSALILQGMVEARPRAVQTSLDDFDQFAEDQKLFTRTGSDPSIVGERATSSPRRRTPPSRREPTR